MNKQLNNKFELWRESNNLTEKAVYRMVNSLRHINPQTANPDELHIIDQLIRAIEYLMDVREYQYKIRKQLVAMDRTIRNLKDIVKVTADKEVTIPENMFLFDGTDFVTNYTEGEVRFSASKVK